MPRTILVSAGHGAGDPGAQGYGHGEAVLALELRDMVAPRLEKLGFHVTRDGRDGENLSKFVANQRAAAADVAMEIHFNGTDPAATGVECFAAEDKRVLAKRLSRAVAAVLGLRLRGVAGYKGQFESQHGAKGLGFCKAGGVLLEVCWMNQRDLDRYLPRKAEVADAIVQVLAAQAAGTLTDVVEAAPTTPTQRGRKNVRTGTQSTSERSKPAPHRRVPR